MMKKKNLIIEVIKKGFTLLLASVSATTTL